MVTFRGEDFDVRLKGNNAEVAVAMDTVIQNYLARYDKRDTVSLVRKAVAETMVIGECRCTFLMVTYIETGNLDSTQRLVVECQSTGCFITSRKKK
ncbi:MAG: hypothetical protein ABGY96_28200 [bacterium]